MTIHKTSEWAGYSEENSYWYEYRLEENRVIKYKCHRQISSDGEKSDWEQDERVEKEWGIDDPNMPDWLRMGV